MHIYFLVLILSDEQVKLGVLFGAIRLRIPPTVLFSVGNVRLSFILCF
jgi:uncharacterized transporter YbjL